jgi:ribosome biogenesis ATPase
MEKRIASQLMTSLDDLSLSSTQGKNVLVLAATSRPEALEPALRRSGRFDHEVKIRIPNENERFEMFGILAQNVKLDSDVDCRYIARHSPGYVGADLKMLITEAAMVAVNRLCLRLNSNGVVLDELVAADMKKIELGEEFLSSISITMDDFKAAFTKIQPAAKREGFAVVPDVTWDDIGALGKARQELRMAVVEPLVHPELFKQFGIETPAGVLLWGPPGCGKTLLAKAVANESHSNFISVKGPELLNKYVGESEKAVRQVFERARLSAPCVIFFDELDALCPKRSDDTSGYASRVVNQLLTEMDGLEGRQSVYIIGATNRPGIHAFIFLYGFLLDVSF